MSDKYNADQLAALGAKGQAFKNPAGEWSFPIADLEDLNNAIRAVGRASGDHDAVRRYIARRAREMGHTDLIPADWTGSRSHTMAEAEERRFTPVPVETRARPGNKTIGGYAAVFDRPSLNLGGFKERIAGGAFNRSRSQGWTGVVARYNHAHLLGTTASGRVRLGTDDVGLTYEVDVPEARSDVYELVERGDVRHSSFRFIADADDWQVDDTGFPQRTLVQVRLLDVGPVDEPAYPETTVGLRSLARKFDASFDEVRSLAATGELRRFFSRTDTPKTRSANAALARVLSMEP